MEKIKEFLKTQKVMTLGVNQDSQPWCAPVYFLFHKSFYFFSSPDSIHILYGINKDVSCSVFLDGDSPEDIKGIQMRGIIRKPGMIEASIPVAKYLSKFSSYIKLTEPKVEKVESFFKSNFYCFSPDYMVFTDNSEGFGTKTIIDTGLL